MHTRPVWVEISRRHLVANYRELRRMAGAHPLLAVVKADAYGHGMRHCAPLLVESGASWIGVTSVEEGVAAREVCPTAEILVMSGIWHGEADAVLDHRLTPIVWESYHLDLLEAAAQRRAWGPQSLPVHLEIDTGMARQGVRESGLAAILRCFKPNSALKLDGVATHFSAPEVLDGLESSRQIERFERALQSLLDGRHPAHAPSWIHAGNSANLLGGGPPLHALEAVAHRVGARLMLRPGLSLYGYAPRMISGAQANAAPAEAQLSPVLAWKTRVTSMRSIDAGEPAGYNSTFRAVRPTRLALLPLGYADGLSRSLSNRGSMLVRGCRAPVAGRISMDQTILDVTGIPGVEIGDEVVAVGSQGAETITAFESADRLGTIPYEVLCAIASRVPRLLID